VWLIEAKATKGMYDHFGPKDRAAMKEAEERFGVKAFLAWRLPSNKIRWVPSSSWPQPRKG
jgi:hypothetical protein